MSASSSKIINKSWGYEEIIHADENYTCKKLVYTRPIASSLHYHPKKHETFVILNGAFSVETYHATKHGYQYTKNHVFVGDSIVIPSGSVHRVRCIEPGTIIEASTFDDPNDVVRLIPSEH